MDDLSIVAIGFTAQLIDGTLGMAFGVTSSSLLLSVGLPPATTSGIVHAAESFTSGASAYCHWKADNIDRSIATRLAVSGVAGAILGAHLLTALPGDRLRPYIAGYLILIGIRILFRAFQGTAPEREPQLRRASSRFVVAREWPSEVQSRKPQTRLAPLGFFGGFFDALGGGGWGPIVMASLVTREPDVSRTIGSVNVAEFFVTVVATVVLFSVLVISDWRVVIFLAIGGLLAAPLGPYFAKRLPPRLLMVLVSLAVIGLSLRTLLFAPA